jgi:hypothetical protein
MRRILRKIIIEFHQRKINFNTNCKLKKIVRNVEATKIAQELQDDYIKLWRRLGVKPSLRFLQCANNISGIKSSLYVPENIHYNLIEPVMNSRPFALAYNDKNFFEKLLPEYSHLFPYTLLRGINGVLLDHEFNPIDEAYAGKILTENPDGAFFIVKPATETGGGSNVVVIQKTGAGFLLNNKKLIYLQDILLLLKRDYLYNFVLQRKIKQYEYFNNFNPSSVNTVRLYTYRSVKDESIIPLHAYIRFGKIGSLVDSSSQGGRTCGIFMNGLLNSFALGKYGEKYFDIEWVNKNKNLPVPFFLQMKELASDIAPRFKYHRLLGFDFTLDDKGDIRLFEINNLFIGIINQQMNTGPLFGEYTDEIIKYCQFHRKTYNFHFYQ